MSGSKLYLNTDSDELSTRSTFINLEELKDVPYKEVPTTAHEFLVSVIRERRNTAGARCNLGLEKLRKNQNQFYDEVPLPPVPDKLKPTKEWQNIQVADFSEVRCYLSRMRNQNENSVTRKIQTLHVKKEADLTWWRNMVNKREPTLTAVLDLKAAKVDDGLENLTKLIKRVTPGDTIDHNIGRWTYAFLSCLKQPLHSDSISIIRDLAKQCWTVRSKIDPESENARELAAPLSLIICIVGHYYRQLDLADRL